MGNPQPDPRQQEQAQYDALLKKLNGLVDSGYLRTPVTPPASATDNPYGLDYQRSNEEQDAGVNPAFYNSMLDKNGQLKAPYVIDPTKSEAFKQMSQIAESSDLSPWAKIQQQMNQQQTAQQRDALNAKTQGQTGQALSQIESVGGGAGSGAALMLGAQGQRANIMGNQNIGAQELTNNLNIANQDAQNKQALLGQVANTETGAQSANAQTAATDTQNANIFSANRYNQLMQQWGAQKTAAAQSAAANNSGGGKK